MFKNTIIHLFKKGEIMKFICKLMDLEKTILSEITQIQKSKHHKFSLI